MSLHELSLSGPQTLNLGTITDPVLIFGGAYSNLPATQALFAAAQKHGISTDRIFCCGDSVAYCASPNETIQLLREHKVHSILGNCEESLVQVSPDCGCGFTEQSACDLLSAQWYRFALQTIQQDARQWMSTLPNHIHFEMQGKHVLLVHGSARTINEFIFSSTDAAVKEAQLVEQGVDVIIGGHSGLPFADVVSGGYWLNCGAIGLPANDGTPDGWYLLLTPQHDGIRAQWYRLHYAAQDAVTAMKMAGIDSPYTTSLVTGLWPSIEILPATEQQQTGQALAENVQRIT